jgi:hypothetical protein
MDIRDGLLTGLAWRKSSFSGGGGNGGANCVELAVLADGRFVVRDSKNPAGDVMILSGSAFVALLDSAR